MNLVRATRILMRARLPLALAGLASVAGAVHSQQGYPNRPVRFIVPNAPGGSITLLARLVGPKITERLGQHVIVDNRPGGNGFIAGELLAKAAPDGYTFMVVSNTLVVTPLLLPATYDPIKDFAPIATLIKSEFVLVTHPSVPAKTVQEFIALAKAKPGELTYATSGSGNANHLAAEMFAMLAGVRMQDVPYKGGGPALIDLLGGQVKAFFNLPITFIPHIRNGKLKAIAVSGDARLTALPQVPTFTEAGLPGYDVKSWQGVIGPARLPRAIVDRLAAELAAIVALPDVRERVVSQGMETFYNGPASFGALMKEDMVRQAKVIKAANIKLEH